MRPLIIGALTALFTVLPVEAQWAPVPLTVTGTPQAITVSVGDLNGQAIPLPVQATAAFVIRWVRGTAEVVPVARGATTLGTTQTLRLGLPAGTFRLQVETRTRAIVAVEACPVSAPPVACPFHVELQRADPQAPWTVARVAVQP